MDFSPRDVIHPEDRAALKKLEAIPLFPTLVTSFLKVYDERFLRRITSLHYIQVGPNQLADLYDHLTVICQQLQIETPQLFLEVHHDPFSFTLDGKTKYIVLSTALLDKLDDEGIRITLAHECGHVFFNHVLYRTMTKMLVRYGSDLPRPLSTLSIPVRVALLYWFHRSEQSADRIAALVAGHVKPVVNTLFLCAETPPSVVKRFNLQAMREQVKTLGQNQNSSIQKLMETMLLSDQEHPFTNSRLDALLSWGESPDFHQLLAQLHGSETATVYCQHCGHALGNDEHQCRHCGQENPNAIILQYETNG